MTGNCLFIFSISRKYLFYRIFKKAESIETPNTLDNPYNSISVTVLLLSSIREIDPLQIYIANVSNLS